MRAYMLYSGRDPGEGAVLVIADTLKRAKVLAYPTLRSWFEAELIYIRGRWLRGAWAEAALQHYGPTERVVDDVPACPSCERWGAYPLEGGGADCGFCEAR